MPRPAPLRLQPLRIGIQWTVAWNSFYELDPPADRDSDNWFYFDEDLLLLADNSARVLVDVSWRPYGPRGRFILSAIDWLGAGEMPEQWSQPMMQFRSRSRERIVAYLDRWLDSSHDWLAVKKRAKAVDAQPLKVNYVRSQKLFEAEAG